MNRITRKIQELKTARKKALIPYLTPEFPYREITLPLLRELSSTADMIEVGIPFSDPLADGKTIQASSEIALRNGVTIPAILKNIASFRKESEVPVILMGYVNPILRYGEDRFARDAAAAGVDGVIVPDLPPEEAVGLQKALGREGVSAVFLIAPTTSEERIAMIDSHSSDFSYCVSVAGVTGQRITFGENGVLEEFLRRVRHHAKKPFVVGFGISTRDHVQHVWNYADGAVVGSAMIDAMRGARNVSDAVTAAGTFIRTLRPAS